MSEQRKPARCAARWRNGYGEDHVCPLPSGHRGAHDPTPAVGPICPHGRYESRCVECGAEPLGASTAPQALDEGDEPDVFEAVARQWLGSESATARRSAYSEPALARLLRNRFGDAVSALRGLATLRPTDTADAGGIAALARAALASLSSRAAGGSTRGEALALVDGIEALRAARDRRWGDALTFDALRRANTARLPEFKNARGEPAHSKPDGSDWKLSAWSNAVCGELGEAANLIKKVERGDLTLEEARPALAREFADVVTYLDILAMRAGVDLGASTVDKFNEVSRRVGSTVSLRPPAAPRPDAGERQDQPGPAKAMETDADKAGAPSVSSPAPSPARAELSNLVNRIWHMYDDGDDPSWAQLTEWIGAFAASQVAAWLAGSIRIDSYVVTNLRALLEFVGHSPGDWVGMILQALPETTDAPTAGTTEWIAHAAALARENDVVLTEIIERIVALRPHAAPRPDAGETSIE